MIIKELNMELEGCYILPVQLKSQSEEASLMALVLKIETFKGSIKASFCCPNG